jgi:hypothetical protein
MRYLPALLLTACAFGCGLAASSYGRWIATAPTPRAAAPFVLPFALVTVGAGASVACAAAAVTDAATRRRS